jgi:transposase
MLIGHKLGTRKRLAQKEIRMSRTVRDTNLETRAARLRLKPRRKPYWRVLETGLRLGFRRTTEGGGSWASRRFVGKGQYRETKIGVADDLQDADGVILLSFKEAQDAARAWWRREQRRGLGHAPDDEGLWTVAKALAACFAHREQRGSKVALKKLRRAAFQLPMAFSHRGAPLWLSEDDKTSGAGFPDGSCRQKLKVSMRLSRLKAGSMLLADRGYDGNWIRDFAAAKDAWADIPGEGRRVERFFNKIKHCRRVATRYDKLAANYTAFVQLAAIRLWLHANESTP